MREELKEKMEEIKQVTDETSPLMELKGSFQENATSDFQ